MQAFLHVFALISSAFVFCAVGVCAELGEVDCGPMAACHPWEDGAGTSSCTRGGRINLRFMVDAAAESHQTQPDGRVISSAVYAFCPVVDKLEVFSLKGAQFVASAYRESSGVEAFTADMGMKYLSVFGFGTSSQRNFPDKDKSAGAVLIGVNGSSHCGAQRSVAMVHTLLLNIGIHKGKFNYIGDKGETGTHEEKNADESGSHFRSAPGNAAESDSFAPTVDVQPAVVGFEPTCNSEDRCLLDSNSFCLGTEPGKKNCASCFTSMDGLNVSSIDIWASYHGTDAKGRPMLSAGLDPLSFRRFGGDDIVQEIFRSIKQKKLMAAFD